MRQIVETIFGSHNEVTYYFL